MNGKMGGYGRVYKDVMRCKTLTPEAKAIYAYLAVFADTKDECYPSVKLIMDEIGMSDRRFYKHINLLKQQGVVEAKQLRENNKWSKTIYKITHAVNFPHLQNARTQNARTQNARTQNAGTNNTSINNTSYNNTSIGNKDIYDTKKPTPKFKPPTVDKVEAYCFEKGYSIDAERFVDFYTSKGWLVGKAKMKDWKAAVRNWVKNSNQRTQGNGNDITSKLKKISEWSSKENDGTTVQVNTGCDIFGLPQ